MYKQNVGKRLLNILAIMVIVLSTAIIALQLYQAEWKKSAQTNLRFTSVDLPFIHEFDAKTMLPFLASAAFDANGDGIDELFLGGGLNQDDKLFKYNEGKFIDTNASFKKPRNEATHGAAHIDLDEDGDVDLFTAHTHSVWYHENIGSSFESRPLPFLLADNTTPLSIALGDPNNDGKADLYISGYIKISKVEGETIFSDGYGAYSYLFLNNGDNSWRDASQETGIWRQHNTFTAVFADTDNDSDSDLIIAQDTGLIETYDNVDGTFTRTDNPSVNSYPMGIGVGDYNNDGFIDIFASNVGHTLPGKLLRGDLKNDAPFNTEYYLFKNTNGTFTDVAQSTGLNRLGFGWGTVIQDMDLDGKPDLLAAQNYVRLPGNPILYRYPGKLMLNQDGKRFLPAEKKTKAINKAFGITPLISDFNNDGRPDLIWANIDGKSKAYISSGGTGESLRVRMLNQTRFLGAHVQITDSSGLSQVQQVISGEGLGSDQSRMLIFGLGGNRFVNATITLRDGTQQTFSSAPKGLISWRG